MHDNDAFEIQRSVPVLYSSFTRVSLSPGPQEVCLLQTFNICDADYAWKDFRSDFNQRDFISCLEFKSFSGAGGAFLFSLLMFHIMLSDTGDTEALSVLCVLKLLRCDGGGNGLALM